jgi:putative ABC transport system permease protein
VKFLPLLLANLGRHKWRTLLTVASIALALFLFASLRTVVTTLQAASEFGHANRLITTNATGIVFPLPLAMAQRLHGLPGIEGVTYANWFGGRYGDGRRFFANFAIEPESYLALYPEIEVPPDQREAFLRDRAGALVGVRLLDVFGWRVGQDVTLQGTIYPGDWTFTIRGTYSPTDAAINDDVLLFHHAYLDERVQDRGFVGWYVLRIDRPENAAAIGRAIDDQFRNSPYPTKTGTEQAFNASFATMWGNVGLLMNTIGAAVVFAILLVAANAMMMSARERTAEIAVLKTIGFSDRRVFGLVMMEAGTVAVLGAVLGLAGAKLLYRSTNFNAAGFLPGFDVTAPTLLVGAGIALLIMLVSGLVPAARAARLPVVQALRKVG